MKKLLEVKVPVVRSYKWHAVPLTVFASHSEAEPWIYNHYLQLCVQEFQSNEHWLEFFSLYDLHGTPCFPWLNVEKISVGTISRYVDLISFLVDCIRDNRYVDLLYDLYYLEHGFTYGKTHRISNLLVYGYDLDEKVFYVMDYTYNTRKRYESIKIEMDILARSVLATEGGGIKAIYQYNEAYQFEWSTELAAVLLRDYLNARNSVRFVELIHRTHPVTQAYGMEIYRYLELYIDQVIGGEKRFSLLPLCVLAEHKQCVRGFSEFIAEKYEIDTADSFLPVYDAACAIKNMGIKYRITKERDSLYKIKEKIVELEKQEPIYVEQILDAISVNGMKCNRINAKEEDNAGQDTG